MGIVNALISPQTTYRQDLSPSRSLKSVEYDLLARITQKLKQGMRDRDTNFAGLAQAVLENQQLWTAFALDVGTPGNALPAPLRAQIVYLCEFTLLHSGKVLTKKASADVLVDINLAIMRGLRGVTGGEG